MSQEVKREAWACQNCLSRGPLNIHGRCGTCDSDAVVSLEASRIGREAREVWELERMVGVGRRA